MAFLPEFGSALMTLVAFVVALSIIVAIHEFGHYIVGRWSGIHAEVFSLGFGPVLLSRIDRRGTKWQLALVPLGGYVRFMGDSDAASGKDGEAVRQMTPQERRRTMHGAPLWARSATVAAGPVFNFALSIIVFAALMISRGDIAEPLTVGDLQPLPESGYQLQAGDEIKAIEGEQVPAFADTAAFQGFTDTLPQKPELDYTVERDGALMDVTGPYLYPPLISQLAPQSAAYDIGLKQGDVITAVDGTPIFDFSQLKDQVEGSDGRVLLLTVFRPGMDEPLEFALAPRRVDEEKPGGGFRTEWRIGIAGGLAFEPARESRGVLDGLWGGVRQTGRIMGSSISGLWHMITGAISTCNMTGPIGIAQTSGAMASQGADSFVWFVAALSTAVGLLNLFPIPVLDGGHLVFHAFEAVTGRPPSDRALRILMTAGLALILTVMVFALTNDIFCP
ncbi:RIP metalloprotease RseP [Pseudooceanicola sp. 216_PA32_1]|uniref:Zinc metalloprotease n=1 Tax=Pseudooceanicola pacificus TaxID=2676438 RepID=A0A844W921_9RHOB|nr:RIP metalloprotease RseP [Pseudooceanicola pacificus]MWB77323.1 RIP metalloprotease RseP [Pseudooceanicola pacificus]